MANTKHKFEFQALLTTAINQKDWDKTKKHLESEFGKLKVALDDKDFAAEANEILELFNKTLEKAKMPKLNLNDLKNDFVGVTDNIKTAIGLLNKIDTSVFRDISTSLEGISNKIMRSGLKSVEELDKAAMRLGKNIKDIKETLKYTNDTGSIDERFENMISKQNALLAIQQKMKSGFEVDWVEEQRAIAEFTRAYEGWRKAKPDQILLAPNQPYVGLYDEVKSQSEDTRINLRNVYNRAAGKDLIGFDNGAPWARETTLKEIKGILEKGIVVKNDGSDAPPEAPKTSTADDTHVSVDYSTAVSEADVILDKLGVLADDGYTTEDAEQLNRIIQERKTLLDSIHESVYETYQDEIDSHANTNDELEKRLALLRGIKLDAQPEHLMTSVITEEEVRRVEAAYDDTCDKVEDLGGRLAQARKELEKIQEHAEIFGFGADKTPREVGRVRDILSKPANKQFPTYSRNQYIIDQLKKGKTLAEPKNGVYGFKSDDLGPGVVESITKTEYEYAQYLSEKIKELNVGWDEGLKILQSQNGQLEQSQQTVSALETLSDAAVQAKEAAYEEQVKIHNAYMKQQVASVGASVDETKIDSVKESVVELNAELEKQNQLEAEENKELEEQFELKTKINHIVDHPESVKPGQTIAEAVDVSDFQNMLDSAINEENQLQKVLTEIAAKIGNKIAQEETLSQIRDQVKNIKIKGQVSDVNPHYLTDEQGKIVEAYRGLENSYAGLVSNTHFGGTFSTDDFDLAKEFAGESGKIEKVRLSMRNPLEIDGQGAKFNEILYLGNGADEASKKLLELYDALCQYQSKLKELEEKNDFGDQYQSIVELNKTTQQNMQAILDDPSNPYHRGQAKDFIGVAKDFGYDGVVLKNVKDTLDRTSNLFATFTEDQIHSIETLSSANNYEKLEVATAEDSKIIEDLTSIKNAVESINNKIVKGTKATVKSDKTPKKEDYRGSEYFPEKLKTQGLYLDKFREELIVSGKATDEYLGRVDALKTKLSEVKDGPDLSRWTEQFKQLRTEVGIDGIFDDKSALTDQIFKRSSELRKFQQGLEKIGLSGSFVSDEIKELDDKLMKLIDNPTTEGLKEWNGKFEQLKKRVGGLDNLIKKYKELGEWEAKLESDTLDKNAAEDAMQNIAYLEDEIAAETELSNLYKEELQSVQALAKKQKARAIASKEATKIDKADVRKHMQQQKDKVRYSRSGSVFNAGNNTMESLWVIDDAGIDSSSLPQVEKLATALQELKMIRDRVNETIDRGEQVSNDDADALQRQTQNVVKYTTQVKELVTQQERLNSANAQHTKQFVNPSADIRTQMINTINAITYGQAKIGEFDATTRTLQYTIQNSAHEFTEYTMEIQNTNNEMVALQGVTKRTETFTEAFTRKLKEFTRYFSASSLLYKGINEVKKGIQYIREIDNALTELKKVTDETEETYDKFLDTASKTAAKVGSTIKDVVSSTADFARLGYSLEEAAVFAESAQILMNVSEFTDISRATDTLISAVQAFGYTAETSMEVVDLLNMIGNNYAISTADLAQSLTKSSASLVAAGGNLAEAAALTATANKIIQDADSVGK